MMRIKFLLPLGFFCLLGVIFMIGLTRDPELLPSALMDQPAPDFTLPPIEGRSDGLESEYLRGQVSLVNIFASWCLPCQIEHPQLVELSRQPGVKLFGINKKDKAEDVKAWLRKHGDPFARIGADSKGQVSLEWGVYGLPETFILDPEGYIRYRHVGPVRPEDVSTIFLPLIEDLQS